MTLLEIPVRYHRFYPGDAPLGWTGKTVALDPKTTALLLIDVYHAAENPDAQALVNTKWDQAWWRVVDEKLVPLVAAVRALALPVIYVMNSSPRIEINRSAFGARLNESLGFDPTVDFRETSVDPLEFDQGAQVQLAIPPQLAPRPGDYYLRKQTYSGFFDTRLDSLLRNLGIRALLCAGFVEDCCVLFTLADAVFRNYQPVLVRDGTLAAELPGEIDTFSQTHRMTVWIESFLCPTSTTEEIVAAIQQQRPACEGQEV